MMLLFLLVIAITGFAQIDGQTRLQTFQVGQDVVAVGTNNLLYMRRSTSDKFSWMLVPRSCCFTQVHVMNNGVILAVRKDQHIWKRRNLFAEWQRVPNSCCVKDVTTYGRTIVGVGTNGKLYSKANLNSKWVGPYPHSGNVIAAAGVPGTIYGVGTNNHIYRRAGLRGKWHIIPGSCCMKDIDVRPTSGHLTHGVGTNSKLYTTQLQNTKHVNWKFQGDQTCCIKSVAIQKRGTNVKIIGVGIDLHLYYKPTLTSPFSHVLQSGWVKRITVLNDGKIAAVGRDNHIYYKTSIDDSTWDHVPHSCCVKSFTQLKRGVIVGVGMDNRLMVRSNLFSKWSWIVPDSGSVTRIAAGPKDELFGIGLDRRLYRRSSLTSKWIGPLKNSGTNNIDITFASDGRLYGLGKDLKIYMKRSKSVTSTWKALPKYNCCLIGFAVR